jgi:hypothetical protein
VGVLLCEFKNWVGCVEFYPFFVLVFRQSDVGFHIFVGCV